jgi:hypothetical protein
MASMTLTLYYKGGEMLTKDLVYDGDSIEAAAAVNRDEEKLLAFMQQEGGCCAIQGFMFGREGLRAAELTEGVF